MSLFIWSPMLLARDCSQVRRMLSGVDRIFTTPT